MQVRRMLRLCLALGVFLGVFDSAAAQVYPPRPITMVVPFPAGGPLDTLARVLVERLRQSLDQPIIIENVVGASGTIGVGRVARAAPDGYTLTFGYLGTHVLNGAIYSLQYDVLKDFEPIAMLPTIPLVIGAKQAVPAKNLKELLSWLKANANSTTLATPGIGSPSHVMGVSLLKLAGAPVQVVHYRGGGPALQGLLGGHVDVLINQPSIFLQHARDGKIKVYAVLAKHRLLQAPEIPTVDQEGVPDLHMSVWHGLWAPKGTPKNLIVRLNAAVVEALADATVRKRLDELGYDTLPVEQQTPHALGAYQKAEIEKWWPIIRGANIKVD
jgi:tripartite-type tricarboxylate transporter receptor subunit TctC